MDNRCDASRDRGEDGSGMEERSATGIPPLLFHETPTHMKGSGVAYRAAVRRAVFAAPGMHGSFLA